MRPSATSDPDLAPRCSRLDTRCAVGSAFGLEVVFDRELRDRRPQVDLEGVTARSAFELVSRTAGHFSAVVDDDVVLAAEDNPQNRRNYKDLAIRTWVLDPANPKGVDVALRSLVEARRLLTDDSQHTVTLRDTTANVAIVSHLVELLERPRSEVDVKLQRTQRAPWSSTPTSTWTTLELHGRTPGPCWVVVSGATDTPRRAVARPAGKVRRSPRWHRAIEHGVVTPAL